MRIMPTLLVAVLLAVIVACNRDGRYPPDTPPTPAPRTTDVRYDGGVLHVEVAISAQERARGLSNRASLRADAGMLFVFEAPRVVSFWMKDTLIPLDMIWIAQDKRITEIDANVQPEPGVPDSELRSYGPAEPVAFGLELNAGAATRLGLVPGSQLEFDVPLQ
jgi:uncharacterized membrane protein (UPF0127 family)